MSKPCIFGLLRLFWQKSVDCGFRPVDGHFYSFLLDYCNSVQWENPFPLSTRLAERKTGLTRKTIAEVRKRLQDADMLRFSEGEKNSSTPIYQLPLKNENGFWFPTETKMETKKETKKGENRDGWFPTETKMETKKETILKNIKNTKKKKTTSKKSGSPSIFEESELIQNNKPKKSPEFRAPTIDDVYNFFRTQDADKRLKDWKRSATIYFTNYDSVGWIDKFGRKITNWQAKAIEWIFKDEMSEQKQRVKNESNEDRFSRRRGTDPTAVGRKEIKGTF